MGKFMLEFSDEKAQTFLPQTIEQKPGMPQIRFVTAEEPVKTEGAFQKTLCYASYYVMTFTAFCAFAPGQVAHAASFVKSGLPL